MGVIDRIDGVLTLAKATTDFARSGGDSVAVIVDLAEQLQSIREELLLVRQEALALQEEKLEMEKRLADLVSFDNTRDQYVLTTLAPGTVVYVLRGPGEGEEAVERPVQQPHGRPGQPPIYYCAHCFEQRRYSYLQLEKPDFHRDTYSCHVCGAKVLVPHDRPAQAYTFPVKRRQPW